MSTPTPDEEAVFHAARRIAEPESRRSYVWQQCNHDPRLAARVEALLRIHAEEPDFLEAPPADLGAAPGSLTETPGTVIGPYKLLEPIGEGGFGVVFMAEQQQPLRRKVALKVIKPGMDSRQVVARFEAERQALALMDHPHIARVLDGGATATGRPYFVMELVRGVPITEHCDRHHLSVPERLALFISVCQAVQHAHQKGIIHRDLQPSNVLVTLHDGTPVVKVIDFGVAKAIGQQLTEKTLFTNFLQMVGTPLYMSPEQAEMSGLDVDTRADIYSLGVLLYELLTGTTPFDRERLRAAGFDEIRRIIREEEPAKPSTRVSTVGAAASTASANRQCDPDRLSRLLRGELDWIVMKCLEKDRRRRYDTANGLAQDVRRYLNGEPVEAAPPSAGYKLRKFAVRHRKSLAAATAFAILLIAGSGVSIWQAVRATRAENAVGQERDKAVAAAESAQKRLGQVEKGIEILSSVFENLDPRADRKEDRPLRAILGDRLVQAADQLEGDAVGDPLVVAGLQERLGLSLLRLGMPARAIPLFEKSRITRAAELGPDHLDTLKSMNNLARAYQDDGKPRQALPLLEETLQLKTTRLGANAPETLTSMNNLVTAYLAAGKAEEAIRLAEEVLRTRQAVLGPDDPSTLNSMNNLAAAYKMAGQTTKAIPLYEETLRLRRVRLGDDHADTLQSMDNLASAYDAAGKSERAMPLYEEALPLLRATLGPDHPATLSGMTGLAMGFHRAGKSDKAVPLFEEILALRKAKQSANHPDTIYAMNNLAVAYQAAGRLDEAVTLHQETLKQQRSKRGPDHPDTLRFMANLAAAYQAAGKLDLALPLLQEAAAGMEKRRFRHESARAIVNGLIGCQERLGQLDDAESWRRKWLAVVKEKSGAESVAYAVELAALGSNLLRQRRWTEAESILRESLAVQQTQAPDAWKTFHTQSLLGGALAGQGKYADAEPLLVQGYEGMKARSTRIRRDDKVCLIEALERLVELCEARGREAEAGRWRNELAAERARQKKPS
jgi:serine/threonine protein kinase/tetratricopeptide (TPR) repeat protein